MTFLLQLYEQFVFSHHFWLQQASRSDAKDYWGASHRGQLHSADPVFGPPFEVRPAWVPVQPSLLALFFPAFWFWSSLGRLATVLFCSVFAYPQIQTNAKGGPAANYYSWGVRTAFTRPSCPGRDVTTASPDGVSMIVPFVMTPRRL